MGRAVAPLRVGSLFAGVGGFDLGFEWCGFEPAFQVELNPWRRRVLAKHWPDAHRHADVRTASSSNLPACDLLCGGFPCQDVSTASRTGTGLAGARSGLWSEFFRLVDEFRPLFVVIENVALLRKRGLDVVVQDLASVGYDAEWHVLRASDFGAWHRRARIWIVAYPAGLPRREGPAWERVHRAGWGQDPRAGHPLAPHADEDRLHLRSDPQGGHQGEEVLAALPSGERGDAQRRRPSDSSRRVPLPHADALGQERDGRGDGQARGRGQPAGSGGEIAHADREGLQGWVLPARRWGESAGLRRRLGQCWEAEPTVGRVAHGVPDRMERLACMGDSLVPQIACWLGTSILEALREIVQA